MEINHLRHFYIVAKAGSFTKAAQIVRVSQSALSKTVALLEAREGIKLLHRSKTGVALTPMGHEVFAKAEQIFSTVTEIENLFRGFKQVCAGHLAFGASDHIVNYLITPRAGNIKKIFPKLSLGILSGSPPELVESLLQDELEFALFFSKVNAPGIIYERVATVEMTIVYRSDLLHQSEAITPLSSLIKRFGFIGSGYFNRKRYYQHPAQELYELIGSDPKVDYAANSQEAQKRLCLEGCGLAYIARFMVEKEIRSGKLKEASLPQKINLDMLLARKRGSQLSFNAQSYIREMGFGQPL